MVLFKELGLSENLMKSVEKMGFEEATPIQAETIPVALQGNDVIGQAQTGTGKTIAFGLPLIEKIDPNNDNIQGLVIAPTRELAIQVAEELYKASYHKRVRVLSVFGGQDIQRQMRSLKKYPHIVVGTPGRLLDHINRKTMKLNNVKVAVLDEADEMLNMGFIEDIEKILSEVPEEHQTLLFSATMPGPIRAIAERFMTNPINVKVKSKEVTVPNIQQYYVETQEKKKFDVLTRLLDIQSPELAIVFGRTKRRVDELSEALTVRGYAAEGIHGDLSQAKRMSVLRKFKEGHIDVLVATDVAARGLDISGVTHVYNFDIPQDPESYVHRVGRTGRAGKSGQAITFVNPREISYLHHVEKVTKRKMEKMKSPTLDEALEGKQKLSMEKLTQALGSENLNYYRTAAEQLLEEHDSMTLICAALKLLTNEPDMTPINLTEESPLRGGGRGGDRGGRGGDRSRGGKGGQGGGKGGQWNKRSNSGDRDRKSSDRGGASNSKRQGFKRSSRKEKV
ncbi:MULTISPECIES: DEAD/DEAH box helicase [Bacillus]|uniref:DEAD/DEAH box helicase n=1 Tax=Bacillus TaxID=1386 RepID=UPI000BB7C75A|nr:MULTISPECIES: DEAD/DEAH box helicase [Bacillus]